MSAVNAASAAGAPSLGASLTRALLRRACRGITCGDLRIVFPDGRVFNHRGKEAVPSGILVLHRWRVLRRLLLGGHIALGESYVDGDWSSPDIVALLTLGAVNDAGLSETVKGTRLAQWLDQLHHALRGNTLRGSRRNIVEHYDLGNQFYRLWLDPSMSYSSALYRTPEMTLAEAQTAKQDRVLELLRLEGGEAVLEIGCGWGSLAASIAQRGCNVTALTLSSEQRDYARKALAAQGVDDRVAVRLEDYRLVPGRYDRIVSIEMFEAVGEAYWPIFFERLRALLKPAGTAVLQVITIADDQFEAYRRQPDFIQRYVFPGGMLASPSIMRAQIAKAGLALESVETFGKSYARTLAEWHTRFLAVRDDVMALGFPPRFLRLWKYYLAYCEAGFTTGVLDVGWWQLRA